jgi:hypothetical protein
MTNDIMLCKFNYKIYYLFLLQPKIYNCRNILLISFLYI